MSKYDGLGEFLRKQGKSEIALTFKEIERIVGTKLPNSQEYPAWWSNSPWNNVMTQIWLDAGYRTEQVDVGHKKLVFRRVSNKPAAGGVSEPTRSFEESKQGGKPARSSLFGALKGTFTIEPGYDLTAPALDPEDWDFALKAGLAKFDGTPPGESG